MEDGANDDGIYGASGENRALCRRIRKAFLTDAHGPPVDVCVTASGAVGENYVYYAVNDR